MKEGVGLFEQAVLIACIRLGSAAYGRAILNEVEHRLVRSVSAGAIYSTLERLESKGFVSSQLAPGTAIRAGRARRYFAPTATGIRALNDTKATTDSLWRGIRLPLKAGA